MTVDPTHTLVLRNKAIAEINKRHTRLKRAVIKYFTRQTGVMLLNNEDGGTNYRYHDDQSIAGFDKWLNGKIEEEILQEQDDEFLEKHWLNTYVGTAYHKGEQEVHNKLAAHRDSSMIFAPDGSQLNNPAHRARTEIIYKRAYGQLKGVSEVMAGQMRNIFADGVLAGDHPYKIAKAMNDRVDKIGKVRSRLIARTEIVRAHNQAVLDRTAKNAVLLDDKSLNKVIWKTKDDGLERETHRHRHNQIYTLKQAQALLGEPNCRCSISPYVPELDDPRIAEEVAAEIKARGDEDSPEWKAEVQAVQDRIDKANRKKFDPGNLTKEQIAAVRSWSGEGYGGMKIDMEKLHKGIDGEDESIDDVSRVMHDLIKTTKPNYKGKIYRGMHNFNILAERPEGHFPDGGGFDIGIGGEFILKEPSSFTKSREQADMFAAGTADGWDADEGVPTTVFVIEDAEGYDISTLARKPQEEEVLMEAGTRFRVLGIDDEGLEEYVVRLQIVKDGDEDGFAEEFEDEGDDFTIHGDDIDDVDFSRDPFEEVDPPENLPWNIPEGEPGSLAHLHKAMEMSGDEKFKDYTAYVDLLEGWTNTKSGRIRTEFEELNAGKITEDELSDYGRVMVNFLKKRLPDTKASEKDPLYRGLKDVDMSGLKVGDRYIMDKPTSFTSDKKISDTFSKDEYRVRSTSIIMEEGYGYAVERYSNLLEAEVLVPPGQNFFISKIDNVEKFEDNGDPMFRNGERVVHQKIYLSKNKPSMEPTTLSELQWWQLPASHPDYIANKPKPIGSESPEWNLLEDQKNVMREQKKVLAEQKKAAATEQEKATILAEQIRIKKELAKLSGQQKKLPPVSALDVISDADYQKEQDESAKTYKKEDPVENPPKQIFGRDSLDEDLVAALKEWSGDEGYQHIRRDFGRLNKGYSEDTLGPYSQKMKDMFEKYEPDFQGELYRGVVGDGRHKDVKVGDEYHIDKPSSFSSDVDKASEFAGKSGYSHLHKSAFDEHDPFSRPVIYVLEDGVGYDIDEYSQENESEVLVAPGEKYYVKNVEEEYINNVDSPAYDKEAMIITLTRDPSAVKPAKGESDPGWVPDWKKPLAERHVKKETFDPKNMTSIEKNAVDNWYAGILQGDGSNAMRKAFEKMSNGTSIADKEIPESAKDMAMMFTSKKPDYKGKLYRGLHDMKGVEFKEGDEFNYDKPASYTKDLKIGKKFAQGSKSNFTELDSGSVIIQIDDAEGYDISILSDDSKNAGEREKEVIIPPGSKYVVKSVKTKSGVRYVNLEIAKDTDTVSLDKIKKAVDVPMQDSEKKPVKEKPKPVEKKPVKEKPKPVEKVKKTGVKFNPKTTSEEKLDAIDIWKRSSANIRKEYDDMTAGTLKEEDLSYGAKHLNSLFKEEKPDFQGSLYRGLVQMQDVDIVVGGEWKSDKPASFSKEKDVAEGFYKHRTADPKVSEEGGVILKVKNAKGYDITDVGIFPEQKEVLVAPNTAFKIVEVETVKIKSGKGKMVDVKYVTLEPKEAAKKFNPKSLSESDFDAIHSWKDSSEFIRKQYDMIKAGHLEEKDASKHFKSLQKIFKEEEPDFKGELYRGLKNMQKTDFNVGDSWKMDKPGSFSKDQSMAEEFYGKMPGDDNFVTSGSVLLKVKNAKGYDISDVSIYQEQKEVLVAPDTEYEISKVDIVKVKDYHGKMVDVRYVTLVPKGESLSVKKTTKSKVDESVESKKKAKNKKWMPWWRDPDAKKPAPEKMFSVKDAEERVKESLVVWERDADTIIEDYKKINKGKKPTPAGFKTQDTYRIHKLFEEFKPDYDAAKKGTLYRGMEDFTFPEEEVKKGSEILITRPTSFTKSKDRAEYYAGYGNPEMVSRTFIHLVDGKGYDIEGNMKNSINKEVIIPPGTKTYVQKVVWEEEVQSEEGYEDYVVKTQNVYITTKPPKGGASNAFAMNRFEDWDPIPLPQDSDFARDLGLIFVQNPLNNANDLEFYYQMSKTGTYDRTAEERWDLLDSEDLVRKNEVAQIWEQADMQYTIDKLARIIEHQEQ